MKRESELSSEVKWRNEEVSDQVFVLLLEEIRESVRTILDSDKVRFHFVSYKRGVVECCQFIPSHKRNKLDRQGKQLNGRTKKGNSVLSEKIFAMK